MEIHKYVFTYVCLCMCVYIYKRKDIQSGYKRGLSLYTWNLLWLGLHCKWRLVIIVCKQEKVEINILICSIQSNERKIKGNPRVLYSLVLTCSKGKKFKKPSDSFIRSRWVKILKPMRFFLCKDNWGDFGPGRASIFCPGSLRTKTTEKDTE